jgi:hypothetical protein
MPQLQLDEDNTEIGKSKNQPPRMRVMHVCACACKTHEACGGKTASYSQSPVQIKLSKAPSMSNTWSGCAVAVSSPSLSPKQSMLVRLPSMPNSEKLVSFSLIWTLAM